LLQAIPGASAQFAIGKPTKRRRTIPKETRNLNRINSPPTKHLGFEPKNFAKPSKAQVSAVQKQELSA
jgi:hypothetical protein